MIKPTIGRVILYCLSAQDAEAISRRRTSGKEIADRIKEDKWPLGAQAHIGNSVTEGDVFPAIVVRVWGNDETASVNAQVLLDGNDTFWATSVDVSDGPVPGKFHWMPYQIGQASKNSELVAGTTMS